MSGGSPCALSPNKHIVVPGEHETDDGAIEEYIQGYNDRRLPTLPVLRAWASWSASVPFLIQSTLGVNIDLSAVVLTMRKCLCNG